MLHSFVIGAILLVEILCVAWGNGCAEGNQGCASRSLTLALLAASLAMATLFFIEVYRAKRNERRLSNTIAQIHAMSDNLPGVLFQWFMNDQGAQGFRYCSSRSEELFGFKAEDVIRDWTKLRIHPGDIARWADSLRRASDSVTDWFFEGRMIMPSGEIKWVRCIAKPVRSAPCEVLFNGILMDITDAKDAEREIKETRRNAERLGAEILLVNQSLNEINERLQRSNRQKNEILGIAAHDLKNPLGGVVGFAGAMRLSLEDDSEEVSKADLVDMSVSIEQSARHMLNIINGLLAAAALEDGTVALDIATCDVTTVVRSVVSLNEASAKHKGITVLVDSEQGCTIEADVQRMQELIDNLVSNAIKYSSPGSRAWVSVVRSSPESIRISVRDEGPGLTPEDMQKLFGKFQKLSARPTGGESSTGLGLAIAKTIVELHGGRIWAESKPGCGATFFVDLPVRHEVKG